MRLAPIALSALAMLGFLEANRRAEANSFSEEESVEPIAPVETAAPAVPQPKAAIAPPEPIQTAPQARSTAPRPIEKAAQKAEKVAASALSSQVTPPPAPAPERIAVSAPAATPAPIAKAPAPAAPATAAPDLAAPPVSRPVAIAQPENASGAVAQPVAQRVEREALVVAVAAVAESKPAALSSQESTPPVRAIAPRLAEKQTVPTAAMTSDATAGRSAPLPVAAVVADATVERSAPLPSTPVEVSAPAEVTNVIVAPAVPVTFVEPTTPRISYSGLIPLLKDDPLNDPREFRPGSMHMETLPVVESPSTGPSLVTESSLTADATTPSLPDTRLAAESRSDRAVVPERKSQPVPFGRAGGRALSSAGALQRTARSHCSRHRWTAGMPRRGTCGADGRNDSRCAGCRFARRGSRGDRPRRGRSRDGRHFAPPPPLLLWLYPLLSASGGVLSTPGGG
ncbi:MULTISPECIES: hypothetical protein [Thermoleptolyngbya]|uniref:hypothetical protein n=1 Tax=Thermoleptolyngbya TaxID=2303528 RepID=UPI001CED15E5|nr:MULTISPECIES: hypothetical protein [Thermoleptolyngbya]